IEWLASLFPAVSPVQGRVTVMFTDIEGFTAFAASRGERATLGLLRRHDTAVLPPLRGHGGRILKRPGHRPMAPLPSPRPAPSPADAVPAALAMQQAAAGRGGLRLRIGVHAGIARWREGDLVGHHVNLASRIADRAPGGQILVSETVRAAARGIRARFRRTRPLVVPGREPTALFRVER